MHGLSAPKLDRPIVVLGLRWKKQSEKRRVENGARIKLDPIEAGAGDCANPDPDSVQLVDALRSQRQFDEQLTLTTLIRQQKHRFGGFYRLKKQTAIPIPETSISVTGISIRFHEDVEESVERSIRVHTQGNLLLSNPGKDAQNERLKTEKITLFLMV
jgi:hypothetical protein